MQNLTETTDLEMADSVLEVSLTANKRVVQELIGDDNMYEALMEIMEPQLILRDEAKIKEGMQRGLRQGLQQGILNTIDTLRDFGHKDSEIKAAIMKKYSLSLEEANTYF